MLEGINIVCFAASYAVVLALEIARLFVYRRWLNRGMLIMGAAGLLAQTIFLVQRAWTGESPLSSLYDWYLVAAWALAATYLYLALVHPRNPFGVVLLPLVLGLIATAFFFAEQTPVAPSQATRFWATVHASCLVVGTVTVMIGFASGLMYLIQAYRLKHKRTPSRGLQLPPLEWSQRINARALVISVFALGGGLLSGVVLNLVRHRVSWTDPFFLTLAVAVAWLFAAAVFNAFYRPAQQGRKVAYLTVANFAVLATSLAIGLLSDSPHGNAPEAPQGSLPGQRPEAAMPACEDRDLRHEEGRVA
jgi:ABC-type uncharacterized transport system permease subunit